MDLRPPEGYSGDLANRATSALMPMTKGQTKGLVAAMRPNLISRMGMTPRALGLAGLVVAISCAAVLGGCQKPTRISHGQSQIAASYSGSTLTAMLPATARVTEVLAAANSTVRARGYTIESNQSDDESGKLVSKPPRTTNFPRVDIQARRGDAGTRMDIKVIPWGDEQLCRSLFDGVLERLGL